MNNLEPLIIELFKDNKISFDQTIELIKTIKKDDENNVSFKFETKGGTYFYFGIPSDIVKMNLNRIIEKVTSKKENKTHNEKDDLIENILKIIK